MGGLGGCHVQLSTMLRTGIGYARCRRVRVLGGARGTSGLPQLLHTHVARLDGGPEHPMHTANRSWGKRRADAGPT